MKAAEFRKYRVSGLLEEYSKKGLEVHHISMEAESEKPRQRVSNADRKVFANPESFCDKFIIG